VRIKFLETYKVKDQEGREFLNAEVYDLPDPTALHFVRRGRAEIVQPEPAPEPEKIPVETAPLTSPVSGSKPQPKSWNRSKK
jgi:hypothetical protein